MRKSYEQLGFSDNFIFTKVMYANPDIAKKVIELVLDIRIKKIKLIEREKDMKATITIWRRDQEGLYKCRGEYR